MEREIVEGTKDFPRNRFFTPHLRHCGFALEASLFFTPLRFKPPCRSRPCQLLN
jgi:hypothetical protein